jgi:hypothetical protein
MKLFFLLLLPFPLFAGLQFGEANPHDGPYVFWEKETAHFIWIENGQFREKYFDFSEQAEQTIHLDFSNLSYRISKEETKPEKAEFQNVEKFFAIADVHGQFELMVNLLKSHEVINDKNQWIFGEGHLIINGDVFDRGPQVAECLWLIHQLEWQAEESGGKVHFLLGNHEVMILQGDIRYVHDSYLERTVPMTNKSMLELFAADTELGRWLRSKNTILKMNDFLFVHAGISPNFIEENLTIEAANQMIRDGIDKQSEPEDSTNQILFRTKGPLWYRGFWQETVNYPMITEQQVDKVLSAYNATNIIVGHTTADSVVTNFNQKVIGIDAGLKRGETGEALLYFNGAFYRALVNGVRKKM